MFDKKHMTVGSWWLYYILMLIPIVNIIVYIMLLLSPKANPSLKSFLWASLIPIIVFGILFLVTVLPLLMAQA